MRAYLTVPTGSAILQTDERVLSADALVLDGSGDLAMIAAVRERGAHPEIYIGIGDVDGARIDEQLAAAMPMAPTGLILTATHGRDVAHLGTRLAVHEALNDLPDGSTRIIASIASAAGAMNAVSFCDVSPRLSGLTWEPAALARELGAASTHEGGEWIAPLAQVRATLRLAGAAASVETIEARCPARDEARFLAHIDAARRDGFPAIIMTDPAQIALVRLEGCQA